MRSRRTCRRRSRSSNHTLDEKQRDFYDGVRLACITHTGSRAAAGCTSQITILDAFVKLRQYVAIAAVDMTRVQLFLSAKLEWLSTVLPELVAEGRRRPAVLAVHVNAAAHRVRW